ncbi:MAG: Abi family protein [Taibaiella sp.]|nr:Abi family protein [Taibaiella sp.]
MIYDKPPLTYEQQIALLSKRGLTINDEEKARRYLSHISYYRLSGYMIPFQLRKDEFNSGITFENVLDLYIFDRELKLIVFDLMERIEVAIRTQMIYQLSHKYGSHWQYDSSIFNNLRIHSEVITAIDEHCKSNNREVFINHYRSKYTNPVHPPSWMCMEIITLGQLSRLYKALKYRKDKEDIAQHFLLHTKVFESWIHTMTYVRNICAHHARLWNREFAIQPEILLKPARPWIDTVYNNNRRCYYFLCILNYLIGEINPHGHFKAKIHALLEKHPNVPIRFMGFYEKWESEPMWVD